MVDVVLREVSKSFQEVKAVDGLSVKIDDGEFFTLLGPSGCGKTTVLRLVAGLETVTKGEIYLGEVRVNDVPAKDRDVAMVFQDYALYPHMSIFENLSLCLKVRKVPKQEIRQKVDEVAELLRIGDLLSRKPSQLSGGQQQRAAVGRAIIRKPKVFLMDEPLSNLDAILRVSMRAELIALQKRLGTTLICVTHDQVEAMTMSDRILVMNRGQVQQLGTPREIFSHPANKFVETFIGTPPMNFVECDLLEKEAILDAGEFRLEVPGYLRSIMTDRKLEKLVVGFRPDKIIVYTRDPPEHAIQARVFVREELGNQAILSMRIGEYIIKSLVAEDVLAKPDDTVWFLPRENSLHIFDKKTETSIAGCE